MQEKNRQYVDIVLDRIKNLAGIDTDIELAEVLSSGAKSISAWRSRGSFNYNVIIDACIKKGWDINHILMPPDGNNYGNNYGNIIPNVHNKVTIKDNKSRTVVGQSNSYDKTGKITNSFVNEANYSNHHEIEELKAEIRLKDLAIARLEGQVELLKSLLNK